MHKTHIALNASYTNSQVEDQQHIFYVGFIEQCERGTWQKNSEMTNSNEL